MKNIVSRLILFIVLIVLSMSLFLFLLDKKTKSDNSYLLKANNHTQSNNLKLNKNKKVISIACGYWHGGAISDGGEVLMWGANWYGQLANLSEKSSITSILVPTTKDILEIACGEDFTIFLKKDGTVLASGNNAKGQLADKTTNSKNYAVTVSGISNVVKVACGPNHVLVLKNDGTVWTWGEDILSNLNNFNKTPIKIDGLSDIKTISCGKNFNLALNKDGKVFAWGNNKFGQLGDGTNDNKASPVIIEGLSDIGDIYCGSLHSIAINKDGVLFVWGANGSGQLGNSSTKDSNRPIKIDFKNPIKNISAGDSHSVFVDSQGEIYTCGGNAYGQLGNNLTTAVCNFTKIKNLKGIIKLISSFNNNMILLDDGSVYSWGGNWKGQVGDGTTTKKLSPIDITNNIFSVKANKSNKSDSNDKNKVLKNVSSLNADSVADVNLEILNSDKLPWQWGLINNGNIIKGVQGIKGADINAKNAWEISKGEGVIIGVIDTGVDFSHKDLKDIIYKNEKEIPDNFIDDDGDGYIDNVNGWNFLENSNKIYTNSEYDCHGTLIAGIVSGQNAEKGVRGVAPNAKILPLKVVNDKPEHESDVIKAIDYANNLGIKVINISFGFTGYMGALKNIMEEDKEILFVCAAGNSGKNIESYKIYPASFSLPNILAVGSINNKGEFDKKSNYGTQVAVAAPGVDILSTFPSNKYAFCTGTSFSAAYVTGVAALIKALRPDMPAKELVDTIKVNVNVSQNLKDKVSTSGIVDAYNALSMLASKDKIKRIIN